MKNKQQLYALVSEDIILKRDELVKHFSDPVSKAQKGDVVAQAIKEMYEKYIGKDKSLSKPSDLEKRYGIKKN